MSSYGFAINVLLSRTNDIDEICPRLDLCPAPSSAGYSNPVLQEQAALPTPELQLARRQDDSCTLCHMVFDQVYSMLNDSSDQRMIENALDTSCLHLPDAVSGECEKLVAEFTAPAIQLLIHAVDSDRICSAVRMCKAKPNKNDEKV